MRRQLATALSAQTIRSALAPAVTALVLLSIWELTYRVFDFNEIILPAPSAIGVAFATNLASLVSETSITMLESVLGFLLGSGAALVLAVVFVHSRLMQDALYPFAIALKSTPLVALAPVLVIWLGNGLLSKVVMAAIVAFFPVLVNAVKGLISIDAEAADLMKSLSASRWQVLIKIRLPASLGYVFSSLKIASALAVVGAVIGEFTGATRGIGNIIKTSSYYLDTPLMFAAIGMIALGGILFFGVVAWLERRIVFWQPPM
jgi:ABC-type nitrate/sulfonate/bicarbonate transport system, permease component